MVLFSACAPPRSPRGTLPQAAPDHPEPIWAENPKLWGCPWVPRSVSWRSNFWRPVGCKNCSRTIIGLGPLLKSLPCRLRSSLKNCHVCRNLPGEPFVLLFTGVCCMPMSWQAHQQVERAHYDVGPLLGNPILLFRLWSYR